MKKSTAIKIVATFCVLVFVLAANSQTAESGGVKYFPSVKVNAAFEKGGMIDAAESGDYKVMAGRRDQPASSEIHKKDTDIFYVLDGSATIITGGSMVEGKESVPDEIRGKSVEGGQSRQLAKGDVIIIPAGVPHWIKSVEKAPLLYFVVKVK